MPLGRVARPADIADAVLRLAGSPYTGGRQLTRRDRADEFDSLMPG